jgi:protein-tyrosine phosphatase
VPALENELVWLLDDDGNADVARVLADTADGIAWLRQRGKSVFVHCVRAESRTPAVAMAWLIRHHGRSVDDAIAEVSAAMSTCRPHPSLLKGVRESSTLPSFA